MQWVAHERPTGTYARQLVLGRDADLDRIDATFTDGVLTLTIPVAEESKPRKIEVTHGSASAMPAGSAGSGGPAGQSEVTSGSSGETSGS